MIKYAAYCMIAISLLLACTSTKEVAVAQKEHQIQRLDQNIPGTDINFQMTMIPAGNFLMGSAETVADRSIDEGPQFVATVDSFWMGTYELSFEEFDIYRNKEKDVASMNQPDWDADIIARPSPPYEDPTFGMGKRNVPAVSMTQFSALQYCKWLSDKSGIFYRLPTEAEWEYACKAGMSSGYYGVGQDIDSLAWHYDNSSEKYHKKGKKLPNKWGLYDMLGNVSEWTLDQYTEDAYASLATQMTTQTNAWIKPTSLHPRTVRGGSWDDGAEAQRCSCRIKSSGKWKERDPQIPKSYWWNTDSPFVGFRIVRPIPQPSAEDQASFWALVLGDG